MDWSTYIDDPALADYVAISGSGTRLLVRRGYEIYAPLLAPGGTAVARMVAESVVLGGRQAHPVIRLPTGESVVVRWYRRGSAFGYLNRSYYFLGNRSLDEVRATVRAGQAGIRVPQVLVAAEQQVGPAYNATLATRWVEGGRDGASWFSVASPTAREVMLEETGRQIALLHESGISHPDLILRNLLVVEVPGRSEPAVYLLDFDRARLSDSPTAPARRARDLRRLGRSVLKLGVPVPMGLVWGALREGYGPGWPLDEPG